MSSDDKKENSGINFERSELRYIFYAHDQNEIMRDFENLGFEKLVYHETPTSITIYFGSLTGLEPGISIKARIYTHNRFHNITHIDADTEFNLLEIKSTLSRQDLISKVQEDEDLSIQTGLMENVKSDELKDIVFRIQRASEDGVLKDSTLKIKSRVKKDDLNIEAVVQSKLTLREIVTLLTTQSELDHRLSDDLVLILETQIRPKYAKKLIPFVMTQYDRIHMIPSNPDHRAVIRITFDPGVDYYDLLIPDPKNFVNDPQFDAEFLIRENFGRLEFKVNAKKLRKLPELDAQISEILQKYGTLAFLSKKWTGATYVSERYIEKQAFWREPVNRELSGFFPVHESWLTYGVVNEDLLQLIQDSKTFSVFDGPNPRILVKNENFVTGYLGVPIPSLVITIEGPSITYELPSRSYPVKLEHGDPEFYILEEFEKPVRSTQIQSKRDLDTILHPSIEVEGDTYFRSYGFLVKSNESNRIYKLTLERKTDVKGDVPNSKVYCKMRYIGTEHRLYKKNKQSIFHDLHVFYDDFAKGMFVPVRNDDTLEDNPKI